MEQTKTLPPLVSDEQIAYMRMGALKADEYGDKRTRQDLIMDSAEGGCRFAMEIYERDRAKTREVVQALVNCIRIADTYGQFRPAGPYHFDPESKYHERQQDEITAIALAKSQCGIEPKTEQR